MLKKLMEQRAELQKSLDAVLSAAKTEERAMNAEETAEFDRIENEIKAIDTTIKAEERARNIGSIQIPDEMNIPLPQIAMKTRRGVVVTYDPTPAAAS